MTMAIAAPGTAPAAFRPTLPPTIDRIVRGVCAVTGYDRGEVLSRRRADVSEARMMVYALAREFGYGLIPIGRRLGRDHTTVLSGARRIAERAAGDPALALMLARARTAAVTGGRAATAPQPEKRDEPAAAAPADAGPDGELEGGMAMAVMAAAAACGIAHEAICDRSQHRALVAARQISAMLMMELGHGLPRIAARLQRDTATVSHGLHALRTQRVRDPAIAEAWAMARANMERLRVGLPPLPSTAAFGRGLQRRVARGCAEATATGDIPRPGRDDQVVLVCRDGKWDLVVNTARGAR